MNTSALSTFVAAVLGCGLAAQMDIRGVAGNGDVHAISSGTGAGTLVGPSGITGMGGLARVGPSLVSISGAGILVTIDPFTGVGTTFVPTAPSLTRVRGMATSPAGVLYVIENGGTGSTLPDRLYRVDVLTGAATLVGTTSHPGLQALAFGLNGVLYAWDVGPGTGSGDGLVTIDPVTAVSTDVNPNVGNTVDIQCLAVSPSNQLYGGRAVLFTLDVATGLASPVGSGAYTDLRGMEFVPAAGCSVLNGTQVNPLACSCATPPTLGTTWNLVVSPGATTVLTLLYVAASALPGPVPLFGGEALILPPVVDVGQAALGLHPVQLPANALLAGLPLYAQGVRVDIAPAGLQLVLTNAIAAQLGY